MIDPSDFRAVGQAVKEAISSLTGYPCEVLRLDLELDGDLGMDGIKYEAVRDALHALFPAAPPPPAGTPHAPTGPFRTIRDMARWFFTGPPADATLPDPILPGSPVAGPPLDGVTEPDRGQPLASGPVTDKLPPNPETLPSIPCGQSPPDSPGSRSKQNGPDRLKGRLEFKVFVYPVVASAGAHRDSVSPAA